MCGGSSLDAGIKNIQKQTDAAIKSVQTQTQAAVDQATGNTSSSSGGKGSGSSPIGPITLTPIDYGIPSQINITTPIDFSGLEANLEALKPNTDQDLAAPVNQALQDINVPKPNTEQLNLSPNLDQDLTKVDLSGGQSMDVTQAIPNLQQMPNVDQDLTKVSVKGLQESAVKQAGDAQDALIDIGTAVQEQAVQSGKTGQEALVQAGKTGQEALVQAGKVTQEAAVQAGKAVQEQAVQTATQVSGGQKNETLEAVANNATKTTENVISTATKETELATSILTKGTETQVQQATNYVEEKVVPVVKDLYAIAYGDQNPQLKFAQAVVHDLEKNTKGLEALGNLDASLNASDDAYSSTTTPMADLDAKEATGNEDPFGNIETATTKADKLTEEERLRRIRRLMLNRYGREDTILTGAKDPFNRRRYARSL